MSPPRTALAELFPHPLMAALGELERRSSARFYIAGGTVRDWLIGRKPADLDIAVLTGAEAACRGLIDILGCGTLVRLGTETEEAARVVWNGVSVDFSAFRGEAGTIEEELALRDFTINAMALRYGDSFAADATLLIDPLHGCRDLADKRLRCCPGAFAADPLRMLRGFRLQAELDLVMSKSCMRAVEEQASDIGGCAPERITAELDRIMVTSTAGEVCRKMAAVGLLQAVLPEMQAGAGMEQPGYHHLDVFGHSLAALEEAGRVMSEPHRFFTEYAESISAYLAEGSRRGWLHWAALLHDLGKPATRSSGTMADGRTTFYEHDRVGAEIFGRIAARLRMSKRQREAIARLIALHMHPFHLVHAGVRHALSRKALLKLCKKAGEDLPGLFVLAMADSLASRGPAKPRDSMREIAGLYACVQRVRTEHIEPVLGGRPLVDGYDLQEIFGLAPSPLFRELFEALELARVEGRVGSRQEALAWLKEYLRRRKG